MPKDEKGERMKGREGGREGREREKERHTHTHTQREGWRDTTFVLRVQTFLK